MATDMRKLPPAERLARRLQVIALRGAGCTYLQIALQLGLSRTGVFNICQRHQAAGSAALHDAPGGRASGAGRRLLPAQERQLRQQIIDSTPDQLAMPEALWTRLAVGRLIERQLGITLPTRTLALYIGRWGFTACRPALQPASARPLPLNRWLVESYPLLVARARAEGADIHWGSSRLLPAGADEPGRAAAADAAAPGAGQRQRGTWMLSALSNQGRLRWMGLRAPLRAPALIDFLRRLVLGAGQKVFLVMDGLQVRDASLLKTWLVAHEDAIETFRLPAA
jgi:transposase